MRILGRLTKIHATIPYLLAKDPVHDQRLLSVQLIHERAELVGVLRRAFLEQSSQVRLPPR
jgi:hypothetical protein